jgi:phosphotransacetylase
MRLKKKKPVFVLQQNSDVSDIVNMAAIAAMEVHQRREKK